MENLLEIKGLSKSFAENSVLENLNLRVNKGEIFGVLGLNGSGKTTLFRCLLQLLKPSAGEILYNNSPIDFTVIHDKIGYLPEFYLPPGELNAREFLKLLSVAVTTKPADIDYLLERTDLDGDKPISDYSRGMIQRFGLAIALLKSPEFIILDEPTLGLDPLARKNLLDWLKEVNENKDTTILLSSHDFSQVAQLCQRIAVLHDHRIIYTGTIEGFMSKHSANTLEQAFLSEIGGEK